MKKFSILIIAFICLGINVVKAQSCSVSASAYPTTIEPGDSAHLYGSVFTNYASYTVSWSPSSSVTNPNSLYTAVHPITTTTYTITLTSPLCTPITDTVTVHIGCSVSLYLSSTPYYCASDAGMANAAVSYGIPPYSYTWSNGQTTSSTTGLSVGSYSVTVTDGYGCSTLDSFSIAAPLISCSAYPKTIEPGDSTYLMYTIFIDGDTSAPFTCSWSPSASVTNPNSSRTFAHPTTTTTYTLTINTPCGIITDTATIFMGCSMSVYVGAEDYYCPAAEGTATTEITNGVPPYTYSWSNGQTTSSLTGLSLGSYSVTITDANGCHAIDSASVYLWNSTPLFTVANPANIAPGDSSSIVVWANFSLPCTYSWSPSSSVANPNAYYTSVYPTSTTTYTVTVTNACATYIDSITVYVMPCTNNYDQSICVVTTDTAINKNMVIWGRNDSPPDGFFNIYDSTSSGWVRIGVVSDTALSEFIDTASNPNLQSYSYKISTVDSCGESSLSHINSTIYLQVLQESSGRDSLYWTPYVGFSAPYYLIYRGLSLNTLTLIDSVTGSVQSFVDTLPPAGSIYLVEAINPSGGCTPTKRFIHGSSANTYASISNGGVPKKVTGIANITYPKNAITISPNPNNGKFTIQSSVISPKSLVEVYNMLGEMIYSTKLNSVNTLVDLSNNSNGVYLYRVISATGDLVSEGKFIKE